MMTQEILQCWQGFLCQLQSTKKGRSKTRGGSHIQSCEGIKTRQQRARRAMYSRGHPG